MATDNPYFAIIKNASGEWSAVLQREVIKPEDHSNFTPFGLEGMLPIGPPRCIDIDELSWYELCDGLREKFPTVKDGEKIANSFTRSNFGNSYLIQFYNAPLESNRSAPEPKG